MQKEFGGKFSAEKVEQIIHDILCDLMLAVVQVSSTLINIKPKLAVLYQHDKHELGQLW